MKYIASFSGEKDSSATMVVMLVDESGHVKHRAINRTASHRRKGG